jgi:threonyl-tRNA synthetase
MIIIGANEVETGQVNLRLLNGEQMNFANLASAIDHLTTICRPPDAINQQQAIAALGF